MGEFQFSLFIVCNINSKKLDLLFVKKIDA